MYSVSVWFAADTAEEMAASIKDSNPARVLKAAVVGVREREGEKNDKVRFVFELEVEWADGVKSVCCRGYQQFFEFQCKLLDTFPDEAGAAKGSQRTLPYLPGKQMFRRSNKQLAQDRLPQLDQYLKELIALPDNISRSGLVRRFLKDETSVHYVKN